MAGYEIANLREEDFKDLVEVSRRSKGDLPFERAPTVEEFRAFTLENFEFQPEGSWVLRKGGSAVAYAFVLVERNRLSSGLDDAYLEFEVVPEERGKGLEKRLVDLGCEYIRSKGVGKARTRCVLGQTWRQESLAKEGFVEAYRVFFLVRRGRRDVPHASAPDGMRLVRRPYKECGDEEMTRIVAAFNETFQDHFNFAPERPEMFIKYRDVSDDPECFSLAMLGDDIVGLCLSHEDRIYNLENGTKWGWINILGVCPAHRHMGVGSFLLADGIKWVLEQGMDTTYIGVYANNERALRMYLSAGFEKDRESIWMEKLLS